MWIIWLVFSLVYSLSVFQMCFWSSETRGCWLIFFCLDAKKPVFMLHIVTPVTPPAPQNLCSTLYSAAALRIYKKTSAAVCEHPRGPQLWTMSSIVSASHSPTVWQRNNRCENVGFLVEALGEGRRRWCASVSGHSLCLALLHKLQHFGSKNVVCGPAEGELKNF